MGFVSDGAVNSTRTARARARVVACGSGGSGGAGAELFLPSSFLRALCSCGAPRAGIPTTAPSRRWSKSTEGSPHQQNFI